MTLAEFLLARIAEDEQVAQDCAPQEPGFDDGAGRWTARDAVGHDSEIFDGDETLLAEVWSGSEAEHIARWDPARVLAECQAKRAVVQDWLDARNDPFEVVNARIAHEWAVRRLAVVYADHPDYDSEWKP